MVLLLILGAFAVIAIAALALLWMYLDGKIGSGGEDPIQELTTRLEGAESEVSELRRRVEGLETIVSNNEI
ncbi:MAG: hypothetical protein OXE92_07910 [Bacteroidetes bacterium]|nr:hypothetical protein [Bacteroidota bacterium]MCY4205632.1 hypothetical protein [Bacteroidota bacterium]